MPPARADSNSMADTVPASRSRHSDPLAICGWVRTIPVAFVVGPMKSGTSWLSRTINAHPQAVCRHESHMAEVLWPGLRSAFREHDDALERWGRQEAVGLESADKLFLLRTTMDLQMARYAEASGRLDDSTLRLLADKTPMHALHLMELAEAYPTARFVCCTRDPRDAAVSAWKHLHGMLGHRPRASFEEYTKHYVADLWAAPIRAAQNAARELGDDRVRFASYERHKHETADFLRDLFGFLGLDTDPRTLAQVADAASFQTLTNRAPGVEARSPHRKGIVGDWRNHMTLEFGDTLLAIAERSLAEKNTPPPLYGEGARSVMPEPVRG